MEASVDGLLALGNVRSVRPTALDCEAKSSAVKLVSARRPIRMAGPEPWAISVSESAEADEPDSGAEWITEDG